MENASAMIRKTSKSLNKILQAEILKKPAVSYRNLRNRHSIRIAAVN
jgi:hypothetical protein